MKRPFRAILGTVLLVTTVCLAYAAACSFHPEVTFPLFLLSALLTILNGAYHASRY